MLLFKKVACNFTAPGASVCRLVYSMGVRRFSPDDRL